MPGNHVKYGTGVPPQAVHSVGGTGLYPRGELVNAEPTGWRNNSGTEGSRQCQATLASHSTLVVAFGSHVPLEMAHVTLSRMGHVDKQPSGVHCP